MGSSKEVCAWQPEADALSGTELCAYLSVFPSADHVSLPLLAAAELLCCALPSLHSQENHCEYLLEMREESSNEGFP